MNTEEIKQKRQTLEELKANLKLDFFGIDDQIDRIVDSLSAWYIMPEVITRPVIINLWGMIIDHLDVSPILPTPL